MPLLLTLWRLCPAWPALTRISTDSHQLHSCWRSSWNRTPSLGYRIVNLQLADDGRTVTDHSVFAEGSVSSSSWLALAHWKGTSLLRWQWGGASAMQLEGQGRHVAHRMLWPPYTASPLSLRRWLTPEDEHWGRPVGLLRLPDSSLLIGDDFGFTIYRVYPTGAAPAPAPSADAAAAGGAAAGPSPPPSAAQRRSAAAAAAAWVAAVAAAAAAAALLA